MGIIIFKGNIPCLVFLSGENDEFISLTTDCVPPTRKMAIQ